MTNKLVLLPAVDVQGGQAVQLTQGVAGSEKTFGDPLAAAQRWQDAGAEWLHLVDLDAAFGRGSNADIIAEITAAMDLKVELSGGLRDDEALERALATGCARVNLGTAALENPEWCEKVIGRYGERIGIAIDVKGSRLAARGWVREGGDWAEAVDRLSAAGCRTFVVTDVKSDGMLTGPNLDLLKQVCRTHGCRGHRLRRHRAARRPPRTAGARAAGGHRRHHRDGPLRRQLHLHRRPGRGAEERRTDAAVRRLASRAGGEGGGGPHGAHGRPR